MKIVHFSNEINRLYNHNKENRIKPFKEFLNKY